MSGFAVALGIGLGLGIERERHKGRGAGRAAAGVRTFALVSLLGAASVRVGGTALLAVTAAFVGAAAVAAYVYSDHSDPGLTTEVALVLDLLLGGLAQSEPALAAAAGTAVALLLVSRTRLHRFARETLSEQEISDGLLLAACALIVLPLVPDEGWGLRRVQPVHPVAARRARDAGQRRRVRGAARARPARRAATGRFRRRLRLEHGDDRHDGRARRAGAAAAPRVRRRGRRVDRRHDRLPRDGRGRGQPGDATVLILAGLSTNTVTKATLAGVLGHRRYALAIWPGLALVLAAAWAGFGLERLL